MPSAIAKYNYVWYVVCATLLAWGNCPILQERKEGTGFPSLMSDNRVKIRVWNFQFILSLMICHNKSKHVFSYIPVREKSWNVREVKEKS